MSGANQRSLNLKTTLAPEHTHTASSGIHYQTWTLKTHTHTKNTQCGCGTNTNDMNSSALGVAIVGEYEDVCHCVSYRGLLLNCSSCCSPIGGSNAL